MARRLRTQPRKLPTQERARATVATLLTATERLLSRKGYEALTTNAIAAEAGVSIGSVYQYFPTKEAIVAAVVDRFCARRIDDLTRSMATISPTATLREVIRGVVSATVAAHLENPALVRVLLQEVPRKGQLERVDAILDHGIGIVAAALAARAEEVRPRNTELAARLLATATRGMLLHEIVRDPDWVRDSPDFVDEVTEILARYLDPSPPPSRAPRAAF